MFNFKKRQFSELQIIILVVLFTSVFNNYSFFHHASEIYGHSIQGYLFLFSLFLVLSALNFMVLNILTWGGRLRVLLIPVLLLTASASYFVDSYGIIIDENMISNVLKTDQREIFDLFNWKLAVFILSLGVLPSLLVLRAKLKPVSYLTKIKSQFIANVCAILIILTNLFYFGNVYASYFREHRELRSYANPTALIFALGKYFSTRLFSKPVMLVQIGEDASISAHDRESELIIFVVGEAARADKFSLNGYHRKTNPLLEKEDVVSFHHMESCGTSTAHSVPCMFSNLGRSGFSETKATNTENLLDVLVHAKAVNVLWRDNNSDSKGVAARVPYEDYKTSKINKACDEECRDIGMLDGLQDYVDKLKSKDIFIVLHQMGNHGPAYYKRYPPEFKIFLPQCETNELGKCTSEEITNAYDNAILYTDFFLSKVIEFLKNNSNRFETAMFYVSDHGESLGEGGVYLHGLPYFIAPDQQTHVASIMWFGGALQSEIDINKLKMKAHTSFSHDNIFHTVLGLFEINSTVYDSRKDMLRGSMLRE